MGGVEPANQELILENEGLKARDLLLLTYLNFPLPARAIFLSFDRVCFPLHH